MVAFGRTLIANANYVELEREARAMELVSLPGEATVLGNVTPGTIEWKVSNIHGTTPWGALNVLS